MSWLTDPWNWLYIDGERLLAKVENVSFAPSRDIQVSAIPKKDGPKLTDQGYVGADTITITLRAWRASMFETLVAQLVKYHPRQQGAISQPRTFTYPLLAAFGIDKVVIKKINIEKPTAEGWFPSIECVQWFPQPKTTQNKPPADGGSLDLPGVPPPDPSNLGPKFT